ncbi:tetraacyldisaccharide 4'-kinase [Pelagicoccus sp. SDUM812003]|uniref:tetraacyldisaccharide 4'-kinase n=1 Tax=Pelagicoccus sp. SDUM812003 TaxID=3041267 RepID=UPI00280E90A6|nr:tetraacyldisaccharide 4'-kinase [Pelagicoccus sp. SDUM812003]MDQ8201996.1 tetraacyldisaccharide 4'-kinase [Pelagicoccus sp. SDUM812003]
MGVKPSRRLLNQLEEFAVDVVYDRRRGKRAFAFKVFLRALSMLFGSLVKLRFFLYRNRILKDQPLGCLVVVVGNLTVGGTGKTPVVEKFARSLRNRGRKVGILSRGYKSKTVKKESLKSKLWRTYVTGADAPPPKVVSDGESLLLDSEVAGDEPYMLAKNLPGVVVLVDKDRVKSGLYAIRHFGCDTLILDDGLQYLPLKGRLNLLLVDKTNPFGNRQLLPRGILREPVRHLKRASYVFLTKSDGRPDPELEALIQRHNPGVDVIECAHKPQYLQEVNGERRLELSQLKGRRIGAFSGIAVPESFEGFLRGLGANLIYTRRFLDHHRFDGNELLEIFDEAKGGGLDFIVTTEKDAVRIPDTISFSIPLYYLRLEIDIMRGADDFDEAVSKICFSERLEGRAAEAASRGRPE